MPSDLDTLPVPLYHSGAGALDATHLAATGDVAVAALPPQGSVGTFAVRSALRTMPTGLVLQRCTGVALSTLAWLAMLAGLAHFFVAALHNRSGELGQGLDATLRGAQACLLSLAIAAVGVPLWVLAEMRLRRQRPAKQPVEAIELG